jgi:hypothetical protein
LKKRSDVKLNLLKGTLMRLFDIFDFAFEIIYLFTQQLILNLPRIATESPANLELLLSHHSVVVVRGCHVRVVGGFITHFRPLGVNITKVK